MSTYRFSWLRPNGWSRLGGVGAVVILFATPMLWALGVFGNGDDTLKRALIFLFSGMWLFVAAGYTAGWAMRGFMVRMKDADDEDGDGGRRPPPAMHAPPAGGIHRPGH
ncbi:hypothetical protein [Magnetospirillum aberrantis]|uniref:Uncharacterized protein n=1 Tax=Magnetospirillum aberrantis SpK TaxID=908842 RepID=A0A7C9UYC4_9PROT|nr:hypothetical protein [Magnetospirillum aberrantis]NFV81492.1 hypothetical protein [Magnetospirillum aberrantis SpK]